MESSKTAATPCVERRMKKDSDMDILVGTNLPGLETVRREGVCLSVVRHADGA